MPSVLVVGLGGVGVITAYGLELNGNDVTCVVRLDYEIATTRGYELDSVDYGQVVYKPARVVRSVAEAAGPFDYVVVTTKNIPEVNPVVELIRPAVGAKTVVVLVQNGMGIEKPIMEAFPGVFVLSGVLMISSTLRDGKVRHVGLDAVKLGYFDNGSGVETQEAVARAFVAAYSNPHNNITYSSDAKFDRWRKLVYNAALNPVCAISNVDAGRLSVFGGKALAFRAMDEVIAAAALDGVVLPEELKEFMFTSDEVTDYYEPLMLVDTRKGNYTEVEVIVGSVVAVAEQNGVPVPTLTTMRDMLRLVQKLLMEKNGKITVPTKST